MFGALDSSAIDRATTVVVRGLRLMMRRALRAVGSRDNAFSLCMLALRCTAGKEVRCMRTVIFNF